MKTAILAVSGVFTILFIWAFIKKVQQYLKVKTGEKILGKIIAMRESRTRGTDGGPYTVTYAPEIEISVNNEKYILEETIAYTTKPKHKIGDSIAILLNSEKPAQSLLNSFWGLNAGWISMLIASLICALVFILFYSNLIIL